MTEVGFWACCIAWKPLHGVYASCFWLKAQQEDISPIVMLSRALNHSGGFNYIFSFSSVAILASRIRSTHFTRHIRNFLALWEIHFLCSMKCSSKL